ncbi:exported hypothetical protein [Mesorhizobium sp. ORS 3359]|nr:exported hypothetical protein [Mesorhizobium sp. ORS 3359]
MPSRPSIAFLIAAPSTVFVFVSISSSIPSAFVAAYMGRIDTSYGAPTASPESAMALMARPGQHVWPRMLLPPPETAGRA